MKNMPSEGVTISIGVGRGGTEDGAHSEEDKVDEGPGVMERGRDGLHVVSGWDLRVGGNGFRWPRHSSLHSPSMQRLVKD